MRAALASFVDGSDDRRTATGPVGVSSGSGGNTAVFVVGGGLRGPPDVALVAGAPLWHGHLEAAVEEVRALVGSGC